MLKSKIPFEIMNHKTKWLILKLASKDMNISEISREIGIAYKNILRHIRNLEKENIIKVELQKKTKHTPARILMHPELKKEVIFISKGEDKIEELAKGKKPFSDNQKRLVIETILNKFEGNANKRMLSRELTKFMSPANSVLILEEMIVRGSLDERIKPTRLGKKLLGK